MKANSDFSNNNKKRIINSNLEFLNQKNTESNNCETKFK
jgi:hypothetical protein